MGRLINDISEVAWGSDTARVTHKEAQEYRAAET
jgi:hypothetical protein